LGDVCPLSEACRAIFSGLADTSVPGAAASRGRLHRVLFWNAGDSRRADVDSLGDAIPHADTVPHTDLVPNNTDLVPNNTDLVPNNTDLVPNNTDTLAVVGRPDGYDARAERRAVRGDTGRERCGRRGDSEPDWGSGGRACGSRGRPGP
jgi:hypothetical protein